MPLKQGGERMGVEVSLHVFCFDLLFSCVWSAGKQVQKELKLFCRLITL